MIQGAWDGAWARARCLLVFSSAWAVVRSAAALCGTASRCGACLRAARARSAPRHARRPAARDLTAGVQVVQVGDRLAHREKDLAVAERAPEQHRRARRRRCAAPRRRPPAARRGAPHGAPRDSPPARARRGTAARATAAPGRPSAASVRNRRIESRNRPSGLPSGSIGRTATLVEIFGSSMSPEISTFAASQYSDACSGEWP